MNILNTIMKIEKEQAELQIKLGEALDELNSFKNKNYNFLDFIKGTKKGDLIQIKETKDYIFLLQTQLDKKEKDLEILKNYIENEEELYEKTI